MVPESDDFVKIVAPNPKLARQTGLRGLEDRVASTFTRFQKTLVSSVKSMLRTTTLTVLFSSLALTASAHPGHGEPGPAHYVTSTEHVLTLAVFVLAASILGMLAFRGRAKA